MRVLILGARAPVALDHARRFHAQGSTVFAGDSHACRLTSSSRAITGTVHLPPPRTALSGFATELCRYIEAERIDLVLPTCEEVFYLSRIRERLPRECTVFAAPIERLRELHSKLRFLELAANCGVHTPASARVDSLDGAREWAGARPIVLKPEYSRFGVHVRLYPQGIPSDAAPLPALGAWVAQEFCPGRELCSYSIAVNGTLRAHVAYEPTYRLSRSSSFYFDPVSMPAIRRFVEAFVRKVAFTGQISFDWIVSAAGGLSVLECNPRAISGLHLFAQTDALPAVIAGHAIDCVEPRNPSPRMIAAVMGSAGLVQALRRGELARWRRDFQRARDVLTQPGDLAPLLGGIADTGALALSALRQRTSIREASTRDIEWDGEAIPLGMP
jgi:hypothetical protein